MRFNKYCHFLRFTQYRVLKLMILIEVKLKMSLKNTVTLSSNGKYWQVFYYDTMGKRRAKSLGSKNKLSKRQAKVLCDRFAAKLMLNPCIADAKNIMKLGEFLERYNNNRTDIRKSTSELHQLTCRYLKEFFTEEIHINKITRAMTSQWRATMAKGELSLSQKQKKLSEASVCIHVRNAKTIFNQAVNDDLILYNPFERLRGVAPEPDKDWKYLSIEEFDKLLDTCPNQGWRLLIALCRLAGLRRGEAVELLWSAINWQKSRLTLIAEKTGKRRIVPIEPKLYKLLIEAFNEAQDGQLRVCPVSRHGLWRNFQTYCRQAGLKKWKDAFKVMRRNCETDWAQKYPQYVVSNWIGHNIQVSAQHYLQIPEELYDKVALADAVQATV
jgi:integrase